MVLLRLSRENTFLETSLKSVFCLSWRAGWREHKGLLFPWGLIDVGALGMNWMLLVH